MAGQNIWLGEPTASSAGGRGRPLIFDALAIYLHVECGRRVSPNQRRRPKIISVNRFSQLKEGAFRGVKARNRGVRLLTGEALRRRYNVAKRELLGRDFQTSAERQGLATPDLTALQNELDFIWQAALAGTI